MPDERKIGLYHKSSIIFPRGSIPHDAVSDFKNSNKSEQNRKCCFRKKANGSPGPHDTIGNKTGYLKHTILTDHFKN